MKEFPYYSTFSSVIKPIVSADKDRYLAVASLEQIKAFLPAVNTEENHDLLPIAFNACVVNRVNKNDDLIDTKTAIAIYKNFIHKQINAEHNRKRVIGVILTAGFSEFGTDKPLTEEQVKDMTGPFNIALGGVIWRIVDSGVADVIEDAGDPSSNNFMKMSASWELGFSDYGCAILPPDAKNLENGKLISTAAEIDKLREFLKALGGTGSLEDGRRVYRQPNKDVLPIGIGVTETPAAEVKGIATEDTSASEVADKMKTVDDAFKKSSEELTKSVEAVAENNISQATNSDVNTERHIVMPITKFNSIQEITDESLKQATASVVAEFISSELTTANKTWLAEKNKLETELSSAVAATKKAKEDYDAMQATVKKLEETVSALNAEKAEREKVEKFNARMEEVIKEYELDDEARAAVVEDVKAVVSDDDFSKWLKKASIFLKAYSKKAKFDKNAIKDKNDKTADPACKDKKDAMAATASVVDNAVDNADKDKAAVTNTTTTDKNFADKFKNAFALENFVIKY
jgi:hypothetical protein